MSNISSLTTIRVTVPAAPTWASFMSLNTWTVLNHSSRFTDVDAPDTGQYAVTGPISVIRDWASAALATQLGSHGSMIHWNGGHNNYFGNEVYRFDLSTLTWTRLNSPSAGPFPPNNVDGLYPDNTPIVPHTYNFVGYRSSNGTFYTMSREINNGGDYAIIRPSFFNFSNNTWTNSTQTSPVNIGPGVGTTCYDATRDAVWGASGSTRSFVRYNCSSDTWTQFSGTGGGWTQSIIVHCPSKDVLLLFDKGYPAVRAVLGTNPGTAMTVLTMSGTVPSTSWDNQFSIKWSNVLGKFFYFRTGSSNIYTLTPPAGAWNTGTWVWEQLSITGSALLPIEENGGVYGKFQVAEWGSTVVGILNNRHDGACQAIRFQ